MEETKKYYTTVLGLPVYKDLGSSVWFDCGYGYLAFCDYGPDRPMATGQCISFNLPSLEDVDRMYEALKTRPALGLSAPPAHHTKSFVHGRTSPSRSRGSSVAFRALAAMPQRMTTAPERMHRTISKL